MLIQTSRFGQLQINAEDLFHFPAGVIGFEDSKRWVLLADAENEAVGWLQSTSQPDVAMAVVSPRRFAAHYRVHVSRGDLGTLCLDNLDRAFILCCVSRHPQGLTMNLKAPVIINLDRRLGCQVVTTDDQPVQWLLASSAIRLRKSA